MTEQETSRRITRTEESVLGDLKFFLASGLTTLSPKERELWEKNALQFRRLSEGFVAQWHDLSEDLGEFASSLPLTRGSNGFESLMRVTEVFILLDLSDDHWRDTIVNISEERDRRWRKEMADQAQRLLFQSRASQ